MYCAFTRRYTSTIFCTLFLKHKTFLTSAITSMLHRIGVVDMDALFIPYQCGFILHWLPHMVSLVNSLDIACPNFTQAYLWAPDQFLSMPILASVSSFLFRLPAGWSYNTQVFNAANYGYCISAVRVCIQLFKVTTICHPNSMRGPLSTIPLDYGYE